MDLLLHKTVLKLVFQSSSGYVALMLLAVDASKDAVREAAAFHLQYGYHLHYGRSARYVSDFTVLISFVMMSVRLPNQCAHRGISF